MRPVGEDERRHPLQFVADRDGDIEPGTAGGKGDFFCERKKVPLSRHGGRGEKQFCGTVGESKRMESIKLDAPYKIKYRVHQQGIGWTDWVSNGTWCGVKGQSKRLEALEVKSV